MKHRAPRIAPPRHRSLERLERYPLEPVRWDMGLTEPIKGIQAENPYIASRITPTGPDDDADPDADADTKSSDRNLALNSLALMLSTVVTGGLGLLFWAAAGRLYPVAEVGSASAVITSAVMLSTLSNLSLGSMYERFLPVSGWMARSFVIRGYLTITVFALVLGSGFLLVAPVSEMFTSTAEIVSFPFFVAVLAVFALQDQTSSGLGVARWAAAKNVFHAVVKFVLLLALFATAQSTAIIAAWAIPAVLASVVVLRSILRALRTEARYKLAPDLPPRRELWSYFGSAYGITALGSLAPLLVPMIVVATLGAEANAYFALTWSIVSALYILISVLVGPFVAEVAGNPEQFSRLTKRFMTMVCIVALGGSFFLAFLAPFGLGLIGEGYRENGTIIVHLAALTIPLSVIGSLYDGLARVQRRMRLAVIVQVIATTIIITGSLALSDSLGIAAVAWAYLAAEAFGAVVLIIPLIRWIRELSRRGQAPPTDGPTPPGPPDPPSPLEDPSRYPVPDAAARPPAREYAGANHIRNTPPDAGPWGVHPLHRGPAPAPGRNTP
ncbi:MAG: lipopolysaccharide biosynthesis protein [Rhodococcus sp. (in: high G+C Gram-positive bacteria)]|nr:MULTISPECIES: lipopolysaccharide biosynthesis protein [Rhodococcus]MCC8929688.1 lipopolysaccharide biosynthesis protein [Rhodococcus sp. I2R]MCZ4277561.1 lipopolysaccharide biosynthesis protein [Rhodococcus yunnanensis]